jgi:hypothetical protein
VTDDRWKDPRWRQLKAAPWTCPCCGEKHQGLPDLGIDRPVYCPADMPILENDEAGDQTTFLTPDFCALDGDHPFVHGVLELPILGAPGERFGLGLWSSLSRKSFLELIDTFDATSRDDVGPWFGWISNELPGYPKMMRLACRVQPRDGGLRPSLLLEPTDHPLAVEQREGVTLERIFEIFAACGHDISAAAAS